MTGPIKKQPEAGWLLDRVSPRTARAIAALAYIAIATASLVPKAFRPTSGLVPGPVEHFAAYFVLGLIGAFFLRHRIPLLALAAVNAVYAGVLEAAQIFIPGRISTPVDFSASTLGSCFGLAVAALLLRRRQAGR